MIGLWKDRAGIGGEPACTQMHTRNEEPYGMQIVMYEPESETERESEEALFTLVLYM